MIDRFLDQPVRSLHNLQELLRELVRERFPTTYWQHLEFNPGAMIDGAWIAELIEATPMVWPGESCPATIETFGRSIRK